MKTIEIQNIEQLENLSIKDISHFFDLNLSSNYVDMLNWPVDFPYKPSCQFKIARSADKLFIKFFVKEKYLKASYLNDQDPVWEDSCVEFFCKDPEKNYYFNFEFNCIGTCIATKREGRDINIVPFKENELSLIERYSSLPVNTFEEKSGNFEWTITVGIPLSLIEISDNKFLNANFYKCGDKTSEPHYLSWNHIQTSSPDFHRPEFFGRLVL